MKRSNRSLDLLIATLISGDGCNLRPSHVCWHHRQSRVFQSQAEQSRCNP
jgi:hypothetical protein